MNSQDTMDFQNAVYMFANAIGGLIEAMGMHALNQHSLSRDETVSYTDDHFNKLMEDRGLHHNAILSSLRPDHYREV